MQAPGLRPVDLPARLNNVLKSFDVEGGMRRNSRLLEHLPIAPMTESGALGRVVRYPGGSLKAMGSKKVVVQQGLQEVRRGGSVGRTERRDEILAVFTYADPTSKPGFAGFAGERDDDLRLL